MLNYISSFELKTITIFLKRFTYLFLEFLMHKIPTFNCCAYTYHLRKWNLNSFEAISNSVKMIQLCSWTWYKELLFNRHQPHIKQMHTFAMVNSEGSDNDHTKWFQCLCAEETRSFISSTIWNRGWLGPELLYTKRTGDVRVLTKIKPTVSDIVYMLVY